MSVERCTALAVHDAFGATSPTFEAHHLAWEGADSMGPNPPAPVIAQACIMGEGSGLQRA